MKRPHRKHKGFFFIWGWRTITTRDGSPVVRGKCPGCGEADARLHGRLRRPWFTLLFIPIFPIKSGERAQRISKCRECGQMFDIPIEQFARRAGAIVGANFSDAIAVYNELRENPADGQRMLKLLQMYEHLEEPGEAEVAARHYPQAFAAEPACAKLLEKMRRAAS